MVENKTQGGEEGFTLKNDSLLKEAFRPEWVSNLTDRLQLYSPWTSKHSMRVGKIAAEIGYYLGFSEEERILMTQTGILHDVGKIYVPDSILDKPSGDLSLGERLTLDRHPRSSFELVRPFDEEIARIIIAHHELQEEKYPRKTKRTQSRRIDILQNALALADVTDALLSARPYKEAWGVDETRQELMSAFDPVLIVVAIQTHSTLSTL